MLSRKRNAEHGPYLYYTVATKFSIKYGVRNWALKYPYVLPIVFQTSWIKSLSRWVQQNLSCAQQNVYTYWNKSKFEQWWMVMNRLNYVEYTTAETEAARTTEGTMKVIILISWIIPIGAQRERCLMLSEVKLPKCCWEWLLYWGACSHPTVRGEKYFWNSWKAEALSSYLQS